MKTTTFFLGIPNGGGGRFVAVRFAEQHQKMIESYLYTLEVRGWPLFFHISWLMRFTILMFLKVFSDII